MNAKVSLRPNRSVSSGDLPAGRERPFKLLTDFPIEVPALDRQQYFLPGTTASITIICIVVIIAVSYWSEKPIIRHSGLTFSTDDQDVWKTRKSWITEMSSALSGPDDNSGAYLFFTG